MAIITVNSNLDDNKTTMVKDIYKYLTIFTIFHLLSYSIGIKDFGILGDKLFSPNFIIFLLMVAISIKAYYLISLELLEIM